MTTDFGRELPPFTAQFQAMQDYYRIAFLEDGYPGKSDGRRTTAHPIYGVYVLNDYLKQFKAGPTPELAEAIRTVAAATVRRMSEHRGTLVFWYEAGGTSRAPQRHYSGLTQAYYAVALFRAAEALGDPGLRYAAEQAFASLLVSTSDGGVRHETERGVVVAEVPQEPNGWILNGWQSVLVSVAEYATLSGSEEARSLLEASAETMARSLALYDDPLNKNSRYGLTGYLYVRLRLPRGVDRIESLAIDVPGEASYQLLPKKASRWEGFVFSGDIDEAGSPRGSTIRLNAVLSRASFPLANALLMRVHARRSGDLTLDAQVGSYDPLAASPVDLKWEQIASASVNEGPNDLRVELPWTPKLHLVGYPTNFLKRLQGRSTNVYHPIHVKRLRELYAVTGRPEFTEWAERWAGYVCEWQNMPNYRDLAVRDYTAGLDVVSPDEYCRRNVASRDS